MYLPFIDILITFLLILVSFFIFLLSYFDLIFVGITEGYLNPVIGRTYALDDAPQSHIDIMDSSLGTAGKLVLLPWKLNSQIESETKK